MHLFIYKTFHGIYESEKSSYMHMHMHMNKNRQNIFTTLSSFLNIINIPNSLWTVYDYYMTCCMFHVTGGRTSVRARTRHAAHQEWHMWEGCANLIVAAMSMKIMGSLLLTPSHTRWATSMFTALQSGFARVKFLSLLWDSFVVYIVCFFWSCLLYKEL